MKNKIYDRIWNRYKKLLNDSIEIWRPQLGKIKEIDDLYYFETENVLKNNLEFDKFKNKYPDSWISTFENLHCCYYEILQDIDQVAERCAKSNNDERKHSLLHGLRNHVWNIVVELEWFLKIKTYETPKTEIHKQSEQGIPDILKKDILFPQPEKQIEIPVQENKIDLKAILSKIQYDKNEETKKKVEGYLLQLSNSECFKEANDKEFAAVALIFFQTGWIKNINTFSGWLQIFSKAFCRKKSTYKKHQINTSIEAMKRKIPFLDKLPIK
jgi:hypothetical protein